MQKSFGSTGNNSENMPPPTIKLVKAQSQVMVPSSDISISK